MAKYYTVTITTTYTSNRVVKADSKEDLDNRIGEIIGSVDLLDDVPSVDAESKEEPAFTDDDVDIDLTTENN